MHTKRKKLIRKGYMLYNPNYMTPRKGKTMKTVQKKKQQCPGLVREDLNRRSTEDY